MSFQKHPSLPGLIHPVDPRAYHEIDAKAARGDAAKTMSQSELKAFAECPHRWLFGYKQESTAAMSDGNLLDVAILTPERFEKVFAIAPETYPCEPTKKDPRTEKPWNWNATFYSDWRDTQEAAGLECVKPNAASDAWKAKDIFFKNEHIANFHEDSWKQVQVNCQWEDGETGIIVPIKCLLDVRPLPGTSFDLYLADVKRSNCAEYSKWQKTVHNFGLHYQAAFYLDAYNAATGEKRNRFEHHIQESMAPWETTHRELSVEFIALGRARYQSDLANYCRALKTGRFMGYDNAVVEPEPWMVLA